MKKKMARDNESLKRSLEAANRRARDAENRAKSSCFLPDAEVFMFDGTTKLIKDVVSGDELLGRHGCRSVVKFVDVTELGYRNLIGLNGRQPRMTQDHPVFSAAFEGREAEFDLGCEPLLFGDVESAVRLRHWPRAESFVAGSSCFWSVDHVGAQHVEQLDSIQSLPVGSLPASTLVYDIIADSSSYCVDGVIVRDDFPAIMAYPQAALLVERLATLAVNHRSVRNLDVGSPKYAPKPVCFHEIAIELQTALESSVAKKHRDGSFSNSDDVVVTVSSHVESTFTKMSSNSEKMTRSSWLSELQPRYAAFAGRISGDPKLAWAASRIWSVSLPMLQTLLRECAQRFDFEGNIDALTTAQFTEVEELVVAIARNAWRLGGDSSTPLEVNVPLQFVPIADFSQSLTSPAICTHGVQIFRNSVGNRMLGEVVSFIGGDQTGKTSLLRHRAAARGYDISNLSLSGSNNLWLIWGIRDENIVDVYLKAPGIIGCAATAVEQRLFPIALLCSSFVAHLNRNCVVLDRAMVSKFNAAASFATQFLKESDVENNCEVGNVEPFINGTFSFAPNALKGEGALDKVHNQSSEGAPEQKSVLKGPSFKQTRKMLALPGLAFVLVNSTLACMNETHRLAEMLVDCNGAMSANASNEVLSALGLFPEVLIFQACFPITVILFILNFINIYVF